MSCTILNRPDDVPEQARGGVLSMGNFDGVHRGHQVMLSSARKLADASGSRLVAVTFDPPAVALLSPEDAPELITPLDVKCDLLQVHGADLAVVVRTSLEFFAMPPEAFVREVLVARFAPRHIVEGPGFFFGHNRAGDDEALRQFGTQYGFEVSVVEPALVELPGRGQVRVSSSLIRQLIRDGLVGQAALCLTRPYTLHGCVVGGEQRGRLLNFPTANVEPGRMIVPGDGVYAARAAVGGRDYASAVSIGAKPTFGPNTRCIEAHLIDAQGDFYGLPIAVTFLEKLRDQVKFPSPSALQAQISKDVQRAREFAEST